MIVRRAILLTGFNSWGKTTHIYKLFNNGNRARFTESSRSIPKVNASFIVESHSNDDFSEDLFIRTIEDKTKRASNKRSDIFCAFCPTRELLNDSRRILSRSPFSQCDEIHLLLLKHKWDFHAELRIKEIKQYLQSPKVTFTIIDADTNQPTDNTRFLARETQIISYLQSIYP